MRVVCEWCTFILAACPRLGTCIKPNEHSITIHIILSTPTSITTPLNPTLEGIECLDYFTNLNPLPRHYLRSALHSYHNSSIDKMTRLHCVVWFHINAPMQAFIYNDTIIGFTLRKTTLSKALTLVMPIALGRALTIYNTINLGRYRH